MADLLFLALVVAFFAVAVLYVEACGRIIGPDPLNTEVAEPSTEQAVGEVRS